jgi:predicted ATP-dependent serine protease
MQQNLLIINAEKKSLFSLNMRNIDDLFPGFVPGDFALIYGSSSINSLISSICVKAQLPTSLGGLNTNVVYVDAGNTFKISRMKRQAQVHHMNTKKVLKGICLNKALTAYQLTTLIMERLKTEVQKYNSKLIVISDITGLFLDEKIEEDEAWQVFSQIIAYLYNFAHQNKIILIVTSPFYQKSHRSDSLQSLLHKRTNVVISLRQTMYDHEFELEKHPRFMLGTAEYPDGGVSLSDFVN